MEEHAHEKTLAILGTVAAIATTTVAAPAQARRHRSGLASVLRPGALTPVRSPASLRMAGYGYTGPLLRRSGIRLLRWRAVLLPPHYYRHYWYHGSAKTSKTVSKQKPGVRSGLFS